MSQLLWDQNSDRELYYGIDRGVLYSPDSLGISWNGLVSVTDNTNASEITSYFLDGYPYVTNSSFTFYNGTLEAFTYPEEFESYKDLGFGLSYRRSIQDGNRPYYQIHILYNLLAANQTSISETINESLSSQPFQWDLTSSPIFVDGYRPTTHFVIDSRYAYPWLIQDLEAQLYGSDEIVPHLPDLDELLDIFERNSILKIIDHGDGSWTAEGPDEVVSLIGPTTLQINWPSAIFLDSVTYKVSSL